MVMPNPEGDAVIIISLFPEVNKHIDMDPESLIYIKYKLFLVNK